MLKLSKSSNTKVTVNVICRVGLNGLKLTMKVEGIEKNIDDISSEHGELVFTADEISVLTGINYFGKVFLTEKSTGKVVDEEVVSILIVEREEDTVGFTDMEVTVPYIYRPTEAMYPTITQMKDADAEVLAEAKSYTDIEIEKVAARTFVYKGQVQAIADLPSSGNQRGDVWNVIDEQANYVWNGTGWDRLSSEIDLSQYAKKSELAAEATARSDADTVLENAIATETSTRIESISNVTNLIGAVSTRVDGKADKGKVFNAKDYFGNEDLRTNRTCDGSALVDAVIAAHDSGTLALLKCGEFKYNVISTVNANGIRGFCCESLCADDIETLEEQAAYEERLVILYIAAQNKTYSFYSRANSETEDIRELIAELQTKVTELQTATAALEATKQAILAGTQILQGTTLHCADNEKDYRLVVKLVGGQPTLAYTEVEKTESEGVE